MQTRADADDPVLRAGDRVAILGGMFVERMQASGAVECELQTRRPNWKLTVRNLGWSGDNTFGIARKRFDSPADGYARLLKDIDTAAPTIVLVAYGFTEAADGDATTEAFAEGLKTLVTDLNKKNVRVALLTPVAMPGVRVDGYQDRISRCRKTIAGFGAATDLPVVTVDWQPQSSELTDDGLAPNAAGYAAFASKISDQLIGSDSNSTSVVSDALRDAVTAKNALFFHHYRPQNETYLFLFRKHEQGNNAVEIDHFRPLIEKADRAIWKAAKR